MSAKIGARQLSRLAVVYVRQSSPRQVLNNRESQARQYGLVQRALDLGWRRDRIRTIDSDLGRSAATQGTRSGFDELCRLLSLDQVGGVFGIEVSRLARNTVEWFQLLDLCRVHEAALIEDANVYLPQRSDDELVLGFKGTISAADLSVQRARMEGGRRNKALRGALYWRVAAAFERSGETIRKHPDQRVQGAIEAVFAAFHEAGTARQAAVLLREREIELPVRNHSTGEILWRPATYDRVLRVLKNPAMGGAYAYHFLRGRERSTPLRPVEEQWEILQPGHHEGYLSWQQWLEVQEQLARNHSYPQGARGPAREGPALLQGLVVCGHCGYAMRVQYSRRGWSYECSAPDPDSGLRRGCFSAGGQRIDREVVRWFLSRATPAGAEAARQAAAEAASGAEAALRREEQALQHCRYEAGLAERRYRQVDPDNRLVAATLEREWERAAVALQEAEQALAMARAERREPPAPEFFAALGSCLPRVWEAPSTSNADRKRLLGCLVKQVALERCEEAGRITAQVAWRGGLVDELEFPKIVPAPPPPQRTDASTLELIRNLSRHYPDRTVARVLNRHGRRSARGLPFSAKLVGGLRRRHDIEAYRPGQAGDASGTLVSAREAARELGVHEDTVYRWVRAGLLPVVDPGVEGAPLRVRMTDEVRSRFRPEVPAGFVSVATAKQRLGVTRQTIWNRVRAGQMESCHVTHGRQRGLYVRLPDPGAPLFEQLATDEEGGA